jgi:hypothetical protein
MRGWLLGGLSALMLMGAAGAASAQDVAPSRSVISDEDRTAIDDMARQLDDALQALGLELGVDVPSLRPIFTALVGNVFEDLPDRDDFSFSVGFDFGTKTTDSGELEPDPERRQVLSDALACAAAEGGLPVIRFERLSIEGMTGHRCLLAGPDSEDDIPAWVFLSTVVLAGPDRHIDIRVAGVAASEEGGPDLAREVVEGQLDDLIALAAGIDGKVIDLFLKAPAEPAP